MFQQQMRAPAWLRSAVGRTEEARQIDAVADRVAPILDRVNDGRRGEVLRGEWLGHALHPLLTDLPLGCFISAGLLDVVGGKKARPAAQRLVGLGLLFVPATALSGAADLTTVSHPRARRVGVVHAVGNSVMALVYVLSWNSRRNGGHWRGVGLGMIGGALGWVTGYLGGHLTLHYGVGVGDRGMLAGGEPVGAAAEPLEAPDPAAQLLTASEAAEILAVPTAQVDTMVAEGILDTVRDGRGSPCFRRADVLAARLRGG